MATELGHEPNRVYIGQDGNLHLNSAKFFNDAEEDVAPALESLDQISITELDFLDGSLAGTIVASKAAVVDSNKDIGAAAGTGFRDVKVRNLDAGESGTAGSVDVFPGTAAKGKLAITCADQTGDTTVTVNVAAMAAARTLTIPEPGAAASFVLTVGTQTVSGAVTFTGGVTISTLGLTITDVNIVLSATTGTKIGTATTQKLAFFNSTPIVQPTAYTQTYSTADKTHANPTAAAVVTTGVTQTTPFGFVGAAQGDALSTTLNQVIVDLADLKQLVNSVIDDLQALGLLG